MYTYIHIYTSALFLCALSRGDNKQRQYINKEVGRALISTSNQSNEHCAVAQYPQERRAILRQHCSTSTSVRNYISQYLHALALI